MPLLPGARLGIYEVLSPLGAGGMGEVYLARDTRLNREVAIKILPEAFARDADRLARFQREAQLLAALNHPNIAGIYGIEEHGGALHLLLEYVPGETLAERLQRGPLPVDEALQACRQIAEALEAAHEKGIVHRDLKPANVRITPGGRVKVLDFGLAKDMAQAAAADPSNSPTLATAADTRAGMVLGTAAYMSPEQARGKVVDRRADIWAFGCVLYECLAGKQAFGGETASDSIAATLRREADLTLLPAGIPPSASRLLRRCLQKDASRRLRDAGDARMELEEALSEPATAATASSSVRGAAHRPVSWLAAAALLVALAAFAAGWFWRSPARTSVRAARVALMPPAGANLMLGRGSSVAISPDGFRVAYIAGSAGRPALHLRALDDFDGKSIPGTEGASNPFFSPDSQWVGFFAEGKLKKVLAQGGVPVVISDVPNARGQAWSSDGQSIFLTASSGAGISRVAASGGKPEVLTTPGKGELSHRWPHALPGGKAVLFTVWNDTGFEEARIDALMLATGERRLIMQGGSHAQYADTGNGTGHLIYARAGGLVAVPFDPERVQVTGTPTPVIDGVITNLSGGAHFSVAATGALVYLPGIMAELDRPIVWVDGTGKPKPVTTIRGMSLFFDLSPDGTRLARSNPNGPNRDIWVHDLERGTVARLTHSDNNSYPVWSSDGRRIAYSSGLPNPNLFWQAADGGSSPERLTNSPNAQFPSGFSGDGKLLAYMEISPSTGADVGIVTLDGQRQSKLFVQTAFSESSPAFSPDGKWLAYHSNESGRDEIYVQPYPAGGRKWQISLEGGRFPKWGRSGREIFYRTGNRLMGAAVTPAAGDQPELKLEKPRTVFEGTFESIYAIAPDSRFLMIHGSAQDSSPAQMNVVLNWFDELRRRAR